ncbi:MAG: DUF4336 domain-containing protein [Labilithrix sp.]|nr:DUF4336 domain-containing protein [Labilithrix sp.]
MLKRIADGVWSHDSVVAMGPGGMMRMPCRATVVRLPDGGLVVHSPVALDDRAASELDALGDVRALVAPNFMHWLFVKAAKTRYPKARVLAAPRLSKKLAGLSFEPLPERGALDGLEGLHVERVQGAPGIDEHVFLHEASRSLLISELLFNVHACESFWMRVLFRLGGTWRKTAQSRVWRMLVDDRAAAAQSATAILSLDFERIVPAHGDPIEDDAAARARHALRWMTAGARPLLRDGSLPA